MKMDEITREKFDHKKITADHKKVDPKDWSPDDPPSSDRTTERFKYHTITHTVIYGNTKKRLKLKKLIFSVTSGPSAPYAAEKTVIGEQLIINEEQ
jgi:hypothetical protein